VDEMVELTKMDSITVSRDDLKFTDRNEWLVPGSAGMDVVIERIGADVHFSFPNMNGLLSGQNVVDSLRKMKRVLTLCQAEIAILRSCRPGEPALVRCLRCNEEFWIPEFAPKSRYYCKDSKRLLCYGEGR
jgi:hypothetical protein